MSGSETASRVGKQVYHTGQGQDERAHPPTPSLLRDLDRCGLWSATHTGSRERGVGPRQTLERLWERLTVGRGTTAGTGWATPLEQRRRRLPRGLAALHLLNQAE